MKFILSFYVIKGCLNFQTSLNYVTGLRLTSEIGQENFTSMFCFNKVQSEDYWQGLSHFSPSGSKFRPTPPGSGSKMVFTPPGSGSKIFSGYLPRRGRGRKCFRGNFPAGVGV